MEWSDTEEDRAGTCTIQGALGEKVVSGGLGGAFGLFHPLVLSRVRPVVQFFCVLFRKIGFVRSYI